MYTGGETEQRSSLVTIKPSLSRAYTSKLLETRRLPDVRRTSVCVMTDRTTNNTKLGTMNQPNI